MRSNPIYYTVSLMGEITPEMPEALSKIFFFYYLKAPHSFETQQTRSSFYSNNDKSRARILKENDFKKSEKADAQKLCYTK